MNQIEIRIQELVDAKGWTVREFAERAGLAYGTAHQLYRGVTLRIDLVTLASVCDALEVEPGDIFHMSPANVAL